MTKKNNKNELKGFLSKYKWWIISPCILLIITYPFIFLLINKISGLNLGEIYTFGLSLKDFMTPWIAFWGIIGAVLGIVQTQRRIRSHWEVENKLHWVLDVTGVAII